MLSAHFIVPCHKKEKIKHFPTCNICMPQQSFHATNGFTLQFVAILFLLLFFFCFFFLHFFHFPLCAVLFLAPPRNAACETHFFCTQHTHTHTRAFRWHRVTDRLFSSAYRHNRSVDAKSMHFRLIYVLFCRLTAAGCRLHGALQHAVAKRRRQNK